MLLNKKLYLLVTKNVYCICTHLSWSLPQSLIINIVLSEVKSPHRRLRWELLAVEQENRKLEEEILKIQIARDQQCNSGGWRVKLSYSSKSD